jgi:hypothetical protein
MPEQVGGIVGIRILNARSITWSTLRDMDQPISWRLTVAAPPPARLAGNR